MIDTLTQSAKRVLTAIFFRRCERWEWLIPLALLVLLLATSGSRLLIALIGVILGQLSMRAARTWKRETT